MCIRDSSHAMGFLGGVSYTILVAKICQDNPDLEVCDLIYKFFEFYSDCKWVDPISIKVGKNKGDKLNLNNLQLLDSLNNDIMPIMTPNYNPNNSAYRVSENSFKIIREEILRGR